MLRFLTDLQTDVIAPWGLYVELFHKGEVLNGSIHNPHGGLVDIELDDGRAILDVPAYDIEYTLCEAAVI